MGAGRRIAIADADNGIRTALRNHVREMGHVVVFEAGDGCELLDGYQQTRPELVIADPYLSARNGEDAVGRIASERKVPFVAMAARCDAATLNRIARLPAFAYLLKPIRDEEVEPAITITLTRYGEMAAALEEARAARQALADRKIIERAKGLLMMRGRIDEPEAYSRLRQSARQHSTKVVDIARSILLSEGLLLADDVRSPA